MLTARSTASRVLHALLLVALLVVPLGAAAPLTSAQDTAAPVTIGRRGDAGLSGYMPGGGPTAVPDILWEASGNGDVIMGMAIHGTLLTFATKDPGIVTTVDRATGAVAWTADLGPETTLFGPETAGDVIVVGMWSPDGNGVVALDAATGTERWRVDTENLPTAPTFADGTVFVPAEGGLSADAALYALDPATGAQRWVFEAPAAKDLGEGIAVADGVAVASAWSMVDNGIGVYAFDVATGAVLWTFDQVDELTMEPVVRDGIALITDLPRTWALDLRSGSVLWEASGVSTGGGAALGDGAAVFGYGDEVRAVSAQDGATLWSAPVSGIAGPPVIASGIVYTAVWKRSDDRSNHWLHALDAGTGAEVWALELEHRVNGNQPLAHDGVLYVDTDTAVVAFGAPGGAPSGGSATEAAPQGGTHASAEFGYTVTWRPPWELVGPQSSISAGQDFLTLKAGDISLAIRATTQVTSPADLVSLVTSTRQGPGTTVSVTEQVLAPDLSHATMHITTDGVEAIEHVEVRPLTGGGVVLLYLSAPASAMPLAAQITQQLVAIDGMPPLAAWPPG